MKKSVLKYVIFIAILLKLLALIYKIFSTRLLGLEGMKIIALITPIMGLFLTISHFSISIVVNQMISYNIKAKQYRNKDIIISGLRVVIITSSISSIILILSLPVYEHLLSTSLFNTKTLRLSLILIVPILYLSNISGVLKGYLEANNRFLHPYISNLIEYTVKLTLTMSLLLIFKGSSPSSKIVIVMLGLLFSEFSSFLYLIFSVVRKTKKSKKEKIDKLIIKKALPLTLSDLISSIYSYLLPLIFYYFSKDPHKIEYYTILYSYVIPSCIILEAIPETILKLYSPAIYKNKDNIKTEGKLLYKIFKLILISSVTNFIILFLFHDQILMFLYNTTLGSNMITKVLYLFVPIYFNHFLVVILQAYNKEKSIFLINITVSTLSLIILIITSILFSNKGLLITLIVHHISRTLGYIIAVRHTLKTKFP